MVKISLLFASVLTLFLFMIPGFILRKTRLAGDGFAKAMSVFTLYVAQVAMLLHGFIIEFDFSILKNILLVFILAFISHGVFYLLARLMFKKAPDKIRKVLRFGLVFSNAGYMGIPVISDVFGADHAIYATIYIVWFYVFCYTLGRLIYTDDKKYVSLKEAFINPAVIPIAIGLIIFLSGAGTWIQHKITEPTFIGNAVGVFYNVLTSLKNMVAPASMIITGARLADINLKGIFKDKYIIPFSLTRLFLFPAAMWVIMTVLRLLGLIDSTVESIVFILCSTPSAAITTMFAELYDGDAPYAGKVVAVTTVLSVITMPVAALLLNINF